LIDFIFVHDLGPNLCRGCYGISQAGKFETDAISLDLVADMDMKEISGHMPASSVFGQSRGCDVATSVGVPGHGAGH
jgi:hypothetical protein